MILVCVYYGVYANTVQIHIRGGLPTSGCRVRALRIVRIHVGNVG